MTNVEQQNIVEVENEQPKAEKSKGARPMIRIVQPELYPDGTTGYKTIGAIWKNVSKDGVTYYSIKIGELHLVGFGNEVK